MSLPTSPEQLISANVAAFDTLLSLVNTSLNSSEKITALNLASVRSAIGEQIEATKQVLVAKDLHQSFAIHGSLLQSQIEKSIANARSFYEISAGVQDELTKLLESKHAELNNSVSSLLDLYAKSSSNSAVTVTAVKSAISAANSAFENAHKAARQFADITDASVTAATNATARAVGNTTSLKKKAA
jgi:phasin family protein